MYKIEVQSESCSFRSTVNCRVTVHFRVRSQRLVTFFAEVEKKMLLKLFCLDKDLQQLPEDKHGTESEKEQTRSPRALTAEGKINTSLLFPQKPAGLFMKFSNTILSGQRIPTLYKL